MDEESIDDWLLINPTSPATSPSDNQKQLSCKKAPTSSGSQNSKSKIIQTRHPILTQLLDREMQTRKWRKLAHRHGVSLGREHHGPHQRQPLTIAQSQTQRNQPS
jgi:hypothetical protein